MYCYTLIVKYVWSEKRQNPSLNAVCFLQGKWKPRMIDNPDYFEDNEPYKMTPIVSKCSKFQDDILYISFTARFRQDKMLWKANLFFNKRTNLKNLLIQKASTHTIHADVFSGRTCFCSLCMLHYTKPHDFKIQWNTEITPIHRQGHNCPLRQYSTWCVTIAHRISGLYCGVFLR